MASRHLGHRSATTASLPARMNDGSYRCTACQRGTGTAFYIGAIYPKESVRLDGSRRSTSARRRQRQSESIPFLPELRHHALLGVELTLPPDKRCPLSAASPQFSPPTWRLSAAAYEQVRGKLDIAVADMGEQDLKNIARPLRTYRVVL